MKTQKEVVSGPWGMIWKTFASVSVILLMGMAFHQVKEHTHVHSTRAIGVAFASTSGLTTVDDVFASQMLCMDIREKKKKA